MDLKAYFENKKGLGILATADGEGKVDLAVYSRPHVLDEHTVAFIMPDRLTHHNLQANPHAAYLFLEDGGEEGKKFQGRRLFLTKTHEEKDTELLRTLRRRRYGDDETERFLVFFRIDRKLAPIGPAEIQD